MADNQDLHLTHSSNFYSKSLAMLDDAWINHLKNLGQDRFESGKKSHMESANAALSILIMIIKLEADLRSKYDHETTRSDADAKTSPLGLVEQLVPKVIKGVMPGMIEKYKEYLDELLLVRHIIAHGYLYEGRIFFDDEWSVTKIEGSIVTGRDRSKVGKDNRTKLLKIQTTPYQVGVFDAITVYRTIETVRAMTGLHVPSENIPHEGKHILMREWLKIAVDGMGEERSVILSHLSSDHHKVLGALWGLSD